MGVQARPKLLIRCGNVEVRKCLINDLHCSLHEEGTATVKSVIRWATYMIHDPVFDPHYCHKLIVYLPSLFQELSTRNMLWKPDNNIWSYSITQTDRKHRRSNHLLHCWSCMVITVQLGLMIIIYCRWESKLIVKHQLTKNHRFKRTQLFNLFFI